MSRAGDGCGGGGGCIVSREWQKGSIKNLLPLLLLIFIPVCVTTNVKHLKTSVTREIFDVWPLSANFSDFVRLTTNEESVGRGIEYDGDNTRAAIERMMEKAIKGDNITMLVMGGSSTKGADLGTVLIRGLINFTNYIVVFNHSGRARRQKACFCVLMVSQDFQALLKGIKTIGFVVWCKKNFIVGEILFSNPQQFSRFYFRANTDNQNPALLNNDNNDNNDNNTSNNTFHHFHPQGRTTEYPPSTTPCTHGGTAPLHRTLEVT